MMLKKWLLAALFAACAAPAVFAQTPDPRIRLSSVGFLPDFPKKATVAAACAEFRVVEPVTGSVLLTGGVTDSVFNGDTRESVWIADFSEFKSVGTYCVEVPGVGRSANFTVAPAVFKKPFKAVMLGMYLWRCGVAVDAAYEGVRYSHAACHTADGSLQYVGGGNTDRNAVGGWHDAGDYNKYVVNSGVTVGLMLKAWENFHFALDTVDLSPVSRSGNIPQYLAEVKWNIDWVAKMQLSDGKVSHKISTLGFCGNIMPERENDTRYFVPWSTAATGSFAGILAQAARIYRPFDPVFADSCLAKARLAYKALKDNAALVRADQTGFSTGAYESGRDGDKRLWAAAELWETTGEPEYLEYLENTLGVGDVRQTTEWADVNNLASLTYLGSKRSGKKEEVAEALNSAVISMANAIVNNTATHGYGRPNGASYGWGTNGATASTAYVLNAAYRLTGEGKYRYAIQDALSYLLGRNYFARSFVTGVGNNPPVKPHCRRSSASGRVWPGYLVGGPTLQEISAAGGEACQSNAPGTCYFDKSGDYARNEIAINWNAAMIYALSCVLPGSGTLSAPDYPGQPSDAVSVRHAISAKNTVARAAVKRVVNVKTGKIDIPSGAKVYGLNGKLIARRKAGDSKMPVIGKNGVFLIKTGYL
jgi:endoglucanase